MIRVTIHMRDGGQLSTDDVQTVRQLVPGNGRKDGGYTQTKTQNYSRTDAA